MTDLNLQFGTWEKLIRSRAVRVKRKPDGVLEVRSKASIADWIESEELKERWAQKYVSKEYQRLGFSKIEGPFHTGPDFRVRTGRKWAYAEVETKWENYLLHGHHLNPSFDCAEFLILLSARRPSVALRPLLPPKVVYIDRRHFVAWYKAATDSEKAHADTLPVEQVAGAMQRHWVTICSDTDRSMAVCPDCDACPYFGDGSFGEAAPFFGKLAGQFILTYVARAKNDKVDIDLRRVKAPLLRRFVEQNPPQ